jgi:hypothetical protein
MLQLHAILLLLSGQQCSCVAVIVAWVQYSLQFSRPENARSMHSLH